MHVSVWALNQRCPHISVLKLILTLSCHVSLPTEGGQINNNVGAGSNMVQQHPYPALSQLAHVYEQQQQQQQQQQHQQQQNKDLNNLNKYASLKAVGECLSSSLIIFQFLRRTKEQLEFLEAVCLMLCYWF